MFEMAPSIKLPLCLLLFASMVSSARSASILGTPVVRTLGCLPGRECLACADLGVIADVETCRPCCEKGGMEQSCADPSCLSCFASRNSTMLGDLDGSSSTCDLYHRCNTTECTSPQPPGVKKTGICNHFKDDMSCCADNAVSDDLKSAFEATQGFLIGLFQKCSACEEAWQRVFCAASCSPAQATFLRHEAIGSKNNAVGYSLKIHSSLAIGLWRSCQDDDSAPPENILFKILCDQGDEKKSAKKFVEDNIVEISIPGTTGSFSMEVVDDEESGLGVQDLGMYDGHNYAIYQFCSNKEDTLVSSARYTIFRVGLLFTGAWLGNYLHLKHVLWLPESGIFIILGMLYGMGSLIVLGPSAAQDLSFDPDMLTLVLLPPIIFYSGFSMQHGNFGANLSEIIIFALFGTLMSTLIVGMTLYGARGIGGDYPSEMNIWESFAFAALISAVDPVATLATFSALKVDPNIEVLVFGESLLNDAVSIVIYKSFAKFTRYGGITSHFTVEDAVFKFIALLFGSIAVGFGIGSFHALVFKYTFFKHTAVLEIIVFLTLAYSSFVIAEMFHFSGIVASLLHGTMAGIFVKPNMSEEGHQRAHILTNTLASLADMMIFLLTGLVTVVNYKAISWNFTVVVLVIILVARFVSVFPLVAILNLCRSPERKIPWTHATIMWWSGLRGAIAIGLCAGIPTHLRHTMMSTTVLIVLFTVFVLGGGTPAILKCSKIGMGKDAPEAHGELHKSMRRLHIGMSKILCNYDEDNDGVDDRYESEEYLSELPGHEGGTKRQSKGSKKVHPMLVTGNGMGSPTTSMKTSVKTWAPLSKEDSGDPNGDSKTGISGDEVVEKEDGVSPAEKTKALKRSGSMSYVKIIKSEVSDDKTMKKFMALMKEYKNGKVSGPKAVEEAKVILKGCPKSLEIVSEIFH